MSITEVSQGGALFRLSWTLDDAEAIQVERTAPTADVLGVLPDDATSFVDTIEADAGETCSWLLTGQTSADEIVITTTAQDTDAPPIDDPRRYEAAMLAGARFWKRRDAPFGVAGGGEMGSMQIGFKDPDVEMILTGLRRTSTDMTQQTWPTVAEFRARIQASATAHDDATLTQVLNTAVAVVKRRCRGAGIA
jgi:hypothetical protein